MRHQKFLYVQRQGDPHKSVVKIIVTVFYSIIIGLIFGAIAHYLLGDWGWAILIVYILLGYLSSGRLVVFINIKSAGWIFVSSIISSIIVFYLISRILVIVFGPAFTFTTSILGLSPTITGYMLTIILGLIFTIPNILFR